MNENSVGKVKDAYLTNKSARGHVKVWSVGDDLSNHLVFQGDNLIVKSGADILSAAVSGKPNSKITHFYVGYSNGSSFDVEAEAAVTVDDTVTSFLTTGDYGYVRIPLAFPASYLSEEGYDSNVPYFTTFLVTGGAWAQHGATLQNGSKLFSLGLVNAQNASNSSGDRLFSKVVLNPVITYDTSHGSAITWGVTFRALDATSE